MSGKENKETIFEAKFPFIREDVFLIARVNAETGRQHLVMQKIDLNTGKVEIEDKIVCIHTAIMDIPVKEFAELHNNIVSQEELQKNILNIRSSEELDEIELTPEEHFKALKSWVAGIAEAGLNSFSIQDEIDKSLNLMYPIVNFIMRFLIKVDNSFIFEYLSKIERECRFEGERHDTSLIANLIPILDILVIEPDLDPEFGDIASNTPKDYFFDPDCQYYFLNNYQELFSAIVEINPPIEIFLMEEKYNPLIFLPEGKKLVKNSHIKFVGVNKKAYFPKIRNNRMSLLLWKKNISKISDIEGLRDLKELKELDLSSNSISKIEGLENLKNLEILNLCTNEISQIQGLEHLKLLKDLDLSFNNILTIEGLNTLTNLQDLNIECNKITEITGLETLSNLTLLHLEGNSISQIRGLENLNKLKL